MTVDYAEVARVANAAAPNRLYAEVAEAFGLTLNGARHRIATARQLGYQIGSRCTLPVDYAEVARLANAARRGHRGADVAAALGVSRNVAETRIYEARRRGYVIDARKTTTAEAARRDPYDIAELAREADEAGRSAAAAVAGVYGITHASATRLLSRLRRDGYDVPWQRGRNASGSAGVGTSHGTARRALSGCKCNQCAIALGRLERSRPHGTTSRYRYGCRCNQCKAAHAAARTAPPPLPAEVMVAPIQGDPLPCRCACGHDAGSVWELSAHTLEAHGRVPTADERRPANAAA